MARSGILAVFVAAAFLVLPASAGAVKFTVDTDADADATGSTTDGVCAATGGGCTLRAAIQEANDTLGADEIALPARDYKLTIAMPLEVKNSLTITGEGARNTIVDAGGHSGVFSVTGGIVSFTGMSITGGMSIAGGGIYIQGAAVEMSLDGVAVHDNMAVASGPKGGGIDAFSGKLAVRNSAIFDNKADAGNTASQASGGGVDIGGAISASFENVTIAGNSVSSPSLGGETFGGGISESGAAPIALTHVTLYGNSADGSSNGGNLFGNDASHYTLTDTIVAAGQGGNCDAQTGAPVLQGTNLSDDASCGVPAASIGDPKLAPLGDHGGPENTAPPTPGSPAVDTASACPASGHDQRGQVVPIGSACDVGAAELGADLSASLTPSSASVDAGDSLAYVAEVENAGADPGDATLTFAPAGGSTVTFVNSLTGMCSGIAPVTCSYGTLGAGESRSVTMLAKAPATGPITAAATASGAVPDPAAANNTASATTTVVPAAAPPDKTPPVLSGLKIVKKLSRKKGGKLRYKLSENASLSIRLDRVGKKKKLVKVGTQKTAGKKGTHTLKLHAKWSGKRPKRGKARLTVVATDAAGNRSKAKTLTARVAR